MKPPDEWEPLPAFFRADEPVGGFESIVQPVVDVAKLQKLDVGELDDFECVGAVGVDDDAGRPVEHDQVVGRVREAQSRVASRTSSRLKGSDSSRTSPAIQSARCSSQSVLALPELKDDVLLAHLADREVVDGGPDLFEPGARAAAARPR